MATNVLVAYATKHGSTKEIAERIGSTLRGRGLNADVLDTRDWPSPDGWEAGGRPGRSICIDA